MCTFLSVQRNAPIAIFCRFRVTCGCAGSIRTSCWKRYAFRAAPFVREYQIDTIFLGGGTPSILDAMLILRPSWGL